MATDIALRMARAVGGDVLYACIEILPREVIAQRMGFDSFDPTTVIDLADAEARKVNTTAPTLVVGMTAMEMGPPEEGGAPDLGQMILDLLRISYDRGCKPLVVVVDSLTDGYNLGASAPRPVVDGVCKLAVEQGWVLVLVEETVNNDASPWSFAVDTVISLEVTQEGRREARVTKHRFGSCQPGPHRLLVEPEGVRVIPCFAAYRNAVRDLALSEPATNRSLRVPAVGEVPDLSSFDVPDGTGIVVAVQTNGTTAPGATENFTSSIGKLAQDGSIHPGSFLTLKLWESHEYLFSLTPTGFHTGTLGQMIDGEEWLEAALSQLATIKSTLTRARIGPTEQLLIHEHRDALQKALSLLASILARRGLIVLVYGSTSVNEVIRAAFLTESWALNATGYSPHNRLKVQRGSRTNKEAFEVAID